MKKTLTILLVFITSFGLQAQLADGSLAPNWNLTDLDGNDHELYDYLDAGKDVIIDFSATWCGPCWSYHNNGPLEDLYEDLGPGGSDEIMVFFIEGDGGTNEACLYGPSGCSGSTWGNWTAGTHYPIFSPTGGDLSVVNSYNIGFWPTLYAINAEHQTVWLVGQASYGGWTEMIQQSFSLAAEAQVTPGPCDVGQIEIEATGGSGWLSYTWSNGDTGSSVEVESGYYDVTIEDANDYFIVIEDIFIQNDEQMFLIDDVEIIMPSCNGADDGSIYVDVDSNDDIDYEWSNGEDDEYNTDLESGEYTLTIYNNDNGCSLILEYEIEEPAELEMSLDVIHTSCGESNGVIDAFATGGTGILYYDFGNGYSTQSEITNVDPGTYTVFVEDENDCLVYMDIVIEGSTALEGAIVGELELNCNISETVVTVEPNTANFIEYSWYNENGELISNTADVALNLSGNYSVDMIDSEGCTSNIAFSVTEDFETPEIILSGITTLDCETPAIMVEVENESDMFLSTWSYIDENGVAQVVEGNMLEITAPGDYSVHLTNVLNGCQNEESFTIELIENEPIAEFTYIQDVDMVELTDQSQGENLVVSWTVDGTEVMLDENGMIIFEENGFYEVCLIVTNECGTDSYCETVEVSGIVSGIEDIDIEGLTMYYNGVDLVIDNRFQLLHDAQIHLYNVDGRMIHRATQTITMGTQNITLAEIGTGVFIVHLQTALGDEVSKFVKAQ